MENTENPGGDVQATEEKKAPAPQPFEWWPQRLVTSVRDETLKGWKAQLGKRADELQAELAKVEGGKVQIDLEFERREQERKERRKRHATGS